MLWDVEIETDHLISTREQDLVIINKKKKKKKKRKDNMSKTDFAILTVHRRKLKKTEERHVLGLGEIKGKDAMKFEY